MTTPCMYSHLSYINHFWRHFTPDQIYLMESLQNHTHTHVNGFPHASQRKSFSISSSPPMLLPFPKTIFPLQWKAIYTSDQYLLKLITRGPPPPGIPREGREVFQWFQLPSFPNHYSFLLSGVCGVVVGDFWDTWKKRLEQMYRAAGCTAMAAVAQTASLQFRAKRGRKRIDRQWRCY